MVCPKNHRVISHGRCLGWIHPRAPARRLIQQHSTNYTRDFDHLHLKRFVRGSSKGLCRRTAVVGELFGGGERSNAEFRIFWIQRSTRVIARDSMPCKTWCGTHIKIKSSCPSDYTSMISHIVHRFVHVTTAGYLLCTGFGGRSALATDFAK